MNLEVLAEVKESMKLPITSGSDFMVFFCMPILLRSWEVEMCLTPRSSWKIVEGKVYI